MKYLFKVNLTTYNDLENDLYKIGTAIEKYMDVEDFNIEEIYKEREFQYNKFNITTEKGDFYFELFHKQYDFNAEIMWGFYRIAATTIINYQSDELIELYEQ